MKLVGRQVTAARDLLGITQAELAVAVGVERKTIARFEAGVAEPWTANRDKIQAELERRGIEFTNSDGIGVRLNFAKAEAAECPAIKSDKRRAGR
jgi:transcriptional regulator with XRE-family HTH domain